MMLKQGDAGRWRGCFDEDTLAAFDEHVVQPLQRAGVPMVLS